MMEFLLSKDQRKFSENFRTLSFKPFFRNVINQFEITASTVDINVKMPLEMRTKCNDPKWQIEEITRNQFEY